MNDADDSTENIADHDVDNDADDGNDADENADHDVVDDAVSTGELVTWIDIKSSCS